MVRKMADSTEENVAGTESIRPIYGVEFVTRGKLFEFAKAAWL